MCLNVLKRRDDEMFFLFYFPITCFTWNGGIWIHKFYADFASLLSVTSQQKAQLMECNVIFLKTCENHRNHYDDDETNHRALPEDTEIQGNFPLVLAIIHENSIESQKTRMNTGITGFVETRHVLLTWSSLEFSADIYFSKS